MRHELTFAARRDWLRLARTENVGPVTFAQLVSRFGEASLALAALPDLARRSGRSSPMVIPSVAEIEGELEAGEHLGARLICACEETFPSALAALDQPPPIIWTRGDAKRLEGLLVAIVGARVASASGQRFARGLAAELGAAGHVVVSGMARGVDGAAHEGALETGTVAVLGGGIDDVYPREHRDLYERIVARGCVVSESRPGQTAQAKDFPRRNRIIAGLSRAVIVVEAELRSGSLITARLAAEQGREVLAVPGSPLDPRARGCNDLIRQGAAVCEGIDDVLRALEGFRGFAEPDRTFQPAPIADDDLDTLREEIHRLLSPTPVPRDEIIRATGAPVAAVLAALTELEIAGRLEFGNSGMVSRL